MSEQRELNDGRYVLDAEPIASGGMGTVWRGFDRKLKRAVAVKELRFPDGLSDSEREHQRARVMTEARAAARLDHPGIVSVYDVIEDDGRPWIVMRLVAGRSLAQEVESSGPLSPRRTAEIGLQVLDALAAAHAEGILHRDVKPQNVLLDADGKAVLSDFGIAIVSGLTRPMTETGLVVGTLGYVAPERLSGAAPGPGSDLWSLGATLYFAVEGRAAYDTGDVVTTIAAIVSRDPEPSRQAGPLAPVIAALMAREVGDRPEAAAVRKDLLATASGRPTFETSTKVLPDPEASSVRAARDTYAAPGGPTARSDDGAGAGLSGARRRKMAWLAPLVAAPLLAGGIAIGMALAGDGDAAENGAKPTPTEHPNRYASAPKVCRPELLGEGRVEDLVTDAQPGVSVSTGPVVRCDWESDGYDNTESLSIRAMVRRDVDKAAAMFKTPAETASGYGSATVTRPRLGDQAELISTSTNDHEARVRISNLTLEIRYSDGSIGANDDEFVALVSELAAAAEAEGN